jgi:hypothetical protein
VIRIQIGDTSIIKKEAFELMANAFAEDAMTNDYPPIGAKDAVTDEIFKVGRVANIGQLPDGTIVADLDLDIELVIDSETGRIGHLILQEAQDPTQGES